MMEMWLCAFLLGVCMSTTSTSCKSINLYIICFHCDNLCFLESLHVHWYLGDMAWDDKMVNFDDFLFLYN